MDRLASRTDNDLDDRFLHFAKRFWVLLLFFAIVIGILKVWKIDISPLLGSCGSGPMNGDTLARS